MTYYLVVALTLLGLAAVLGGYVGYCVGHFVARRQLYPLMRELQGQVSLLRMNLAAARLSKAISRVRRPRSAA